ncbi:autotransporter outer membrane beta-barrel domain-containing protein [Bartonella raoultii]|uniref:autotransporter outer membrane beta-barrel domain-containing protein n=1 Tax=Bartonella raoultii TaxID=1457020 RepID=UPI001ABB7F64|nr:autotransporter outer membrane beta-barrel domain-containing protein [Bartonella raoultii]
MAGLLKNRFSLCTFTTALLFLTHHIDGFAHNAESQVLSSKKPSSCGQNVTFYQCDDGEAHEINNKVYSLTDQNAHGAIEVSKEHTSLRGNNITVKGILDEKNNSENKFWKYGVKASEKAGVSLTDSMLSGVLVGVESRDSSIAISGGSIDAINVGALAEGKSQSSVHLTNTQVNFGNLGFKAGEKGQFILESVSMSGKGGPSKGGQGQNADHKGDNAAFHISGNGYVQFMKGSVDVSDVHGLLLRGNKGPQIDIGDSNITVKGNAFHGMHFEGQGASEEQGAKARRVDLKKTRFVVPESIALYSSKSGKSEISLKDTKLFGDLLLKAEGGSSIKVTTNASALVGQTQIDNSSVADLILNNNSQWALLRPKHKNLQDPDYRDVSFISSVHLVNSSIVFEKPKSSTAHTYQTLHIGRENIGKERGVVYRASGNAWIHLNAHLNPHDTSGHQVTDRLLIHGDVSGKTIVHIYGVAGGLEEKNGKAHSVSIIQVYGNAWSDSFQLNGQYVALDGAPYKYVLRSYSPKATGAEEHVKQRFAQNGGAFWNFRLENEYVQTSTDYRGTPRVSKRTPPTRTSFEDVVPASSEGAVSASSGGVVLASSADNLSKVETVSLSGRGVRSVVPQVSTYLILPNSLFHAGLMDISNQNKQLEIQRAHLRETLEIRENPASFLRGYGGSYRYTSDLSALEYGYGGDLGYYALEAGVLLQKIENVESAISFGVMGSYGKLSLQPLDVEYSQKSTFDKWTATVYGSLQHDTGFYVDGLASYGLFKGDVVTTVRGKTATLKGNPLSVSLMSGQKIATGYEGVVFDPQAQVVYQYLQFDEARDIDHFNIEMDKLDQWVVRVGGRLMKTLAGPEKDRDVSFYGKIHFAHDFGKERSVRFKDSFQLGAFGSSLEAGLGLNAHLSQNFALHGDLVYQHKLSKGGFSGISFSGGLRYRF